MIPNKFHIHSPLFKKGHRYGYTGYGFSLKPFILIFMRGYEMKNNKLKVL